MSRWTIGLVLVTGLWGCGHVESEGDGTETLENGGTASATAGTGGVSTQPGTSGSNSCGAGPTPGTAGGGPIPGGTASTGGAPGTGGSAGAPSQPPFAPQCEVENEFRSECSVEETCALLGCGDGISRFDAQGCNRECQSSKDCGAGERCRFTTLAFEVECGAPSEVEGCWLEEGACSCSATADCGFANVCVKAADYPVEEDCDISAVTCANGSELADFRLTPLARDESATEWQVAVGTCYDKVTAKLEQLGCPYLPFEG
jgi:hypothetical protein